MNCPPPDPLATPWGGADARLWAAPGLVEPQGTGALRAVVGAATPPAGASVALLAARPSEPGKIWNCADLLIDLPSTWADVVLLISVRLGNFRSDVEQVTIRDLATASRVTRGGGRLAGILASVRGRPFSELTVEAYPTGVDHEAGRVGAWCWGDGGALASDRAGRPVVDVAASPSQQRAPIVHQGAAAFPVPIAAENPRGGALAIYSLDVSTTVRALGGGVFTLSGQDLVTGAVLPLFESVVAANEPIHRTFSPPLRTGPRTELLASVATLTPSDLRLTLGVFDQ